MLLQSVGVESFQERLVVKIFWKVAVEFSREVEIIGGEGQIVSGGGGGGGS